ncbi:MAG: FecR family protein [Kiritimatiellae bacterium]|nr:FecR family protein [Kiritimatiellia bacterium]
MKRAEELIHKFLDDALTPSEGEELASLLEQGGAEAEAAMELLQMEGLLRGEFVECDVIRAVVEAVQEQASRKTVAEVLKKISDRRPGVHHAADVFRWSAARPFSRWGLAAAAAFAIFVGAYSAWRFLANTKPGAVPASSATPEPVAAVDDRSPKPVDVEHESGMPPEYILTGEEESRVVTLAAMGELSVGPNTILVLTHAEEGPRIELHDGRVNVELEPLPSGKVFAVVTPRLTVEVVGTRFLVEHVEDVSRVKVAEGKVDVVFEAEGKRVALLAGQELISPAPQQNGSTQQKPWKGTLYVIR